jgi:hypothetical protein
MFIPDSGSCFLPIPDSGSRILDPGSRIKKQVEKRGVKKNLLKEKSLAEISKNYGTFYPKSSQ